MAVITEPAVSLSRSALPRLSLAERDRRWKAVRAKMVAQDVTLLLAHCDSGKWDQKSANVRYLSQVGGNGEDGWLVFPLESEPSFHGFSGGTMHYMWTEVQDWITDVRPEPGLRWSNALIKRVEELGQERARIGIVGLEGFQELEGTASYITITRLKERFPHAEIVDMTRTIERMRMVKSPEEIGFIEQAAHIGDEAIKVMRREAQPGVPEYQVYAHTIARMIEAGSEQPVSFFWDAGSNVSHGQRFAGRKILEEGDVIVTELSPRYFGYWVQFSAPTAVGRVTPEYQRLFDVAQSAYWNARKTLRPGIKLMELAKAFEEPIIESGLTSLHVHVHGTGHRGSDSPVLFPPSRLEGMPAGALASAKGVLDFDAEEGMVFAFEPHVSYGPRKPGLHLGDPVAVTATGCRSLSQLDIGDWVSRA